MNEEEAEAAGWYALRTRSRHEKLVADALSRRGTDAFLPTYRRRSRWKDRFRTIEAPLFPGYCFARAAAGVRRLATMTRGVVQVVGSSATGPEMVPADEIERIRTLVANGAGLDPHPYLAEGDEVEVVRGPLAGVRGRLLRKDRATRLVVGVTLIRQAAAVDVDAADVTPVG